MKELGELARLAARYAGETGVVPDIHFDDYIFRFLVDNRLFDSVDSAVRYYFFDGRESARKLIQLLDELAVKPSATGFSILEFASGYGCVSRHLSSKVGIADLVACDIHQEAVQFIRARLGLKAILSCASPKDFHCSRSFDVVFALSFFSHMPRHTWRDWVDALYAVLEPGGVLVFTTQGRQSARLFGDPAIPEDGFWFLRESEQKDLDVSEYGQTIVTEAFVRNEIRAVTGRDADVFREGFWWGHQDLYAVRKHDRGTLLPITMFSFEEAVIRDIEADPTKVSASTIRQALRQLCIDDFGQLLLRMPDSRYPKLSRALPQMASEEVQVGWTGASGYTLLRQSLTFVRATWHSYERITGKRLSEARMLDYGCGYGRHLRLMMYFADDERLFGCDPWDKSIELCRNSGIGCDLRITDYLPKGLPYESASFDLIYAFSVFTHTSARATAAALAALHEIIKSGGLLVITVRPVEYWDIQKGLSDSERLSLKSQHLNTGFAFLPHSYSTIDGDVTYGDTSMSLQHIERSFPDWRIVGHESTLDDPYQRIVYMQHSDR